MAKEHKKLNDRKIRSLIESESVINWRDWRIEIA